MPDDPRYYMDFTGTGNSLNPVHPSVLRLIMDSLRYWVIECHVDGFRFDLASALARELYDVDRLSAFFDIDPPGPGALAGQADRRAVGRRARAATRSATSRCCGRSGTASTATRCATSGAARRGLGDFASRLTGSATSTRPTAATRSPRSTSSPPTTASRCADLVSYNEKHNEANVEDNRDGTDDNRSLELRRRGPDRRPGDPRRCARASSATSSPRCCSRRACRCCSAATRSAAPRTATTTPGARTTRSPGSTGIDDERDAASCSTFTRRLIALRRDAPGASAARASSTGDGAEGLGPAGRLVVPRRRPPDDAARLAAPARGVLGDVPERRGDHHARRRAARTIERRLVPAALQRRPRGLRRSRCPAAASATRWALELSTADPAAEPGSATLRGPRRA